MGIFLIAKREKNEFLLPWGWRTEKFGGNGNKKSSVKKVNRGVREGRGDDRKMRTKGYPGLC